MSENTSISVVITSYNHGCFLAESVSSALGQSQVPIEIIVVDDGSLDDTRVVAESFGENISYFYQDNKGVSAARNAGIANASGDVIAFLDADDTWNSEKLEKQVALFETDKDIGLVHCGMREFDSDSGRTIKIRSDGVEGWAAEEILKWESEKSVGTGSTIMVPRSVIDEVGGFDTQLTNGEDWEFCLRVARKYKVGFVPEPLVEYRSHGTNVSKNINQMERSTLIAWKKAFSISDDKLRPLRRRSYGNLHKVLAGSHLQHGNYLGFARNVVKSLWYRPSYFGYYFALLFRGRKN